MKKEHIPRPAVTQQQPRPQHLAGPLRRSQALRLLASRATLHPEFPHLVFSHEPFPWY